MLGPDGCTSWLSQSLHAPLPHLLPWRLLDGGIIIIIIIIIIEFSKGIADLVLFFLCNMRCNMHYYYYYYYYYYYMYSMYEHTMHIKDMHHAFLYNFEG